MNNAQHRNKDTEIKPSITQQQLEHDLKVKNNARGLQKMTQNVVQAFKERIISFNLDAKPDQQETLTNEFEYVSKIDDWRPLASVPGITEPPMKEVKKQNLENLLKNLDRNVQSLKQKQYFNDESQKQNQNSELTQRQAKILNNMITMIQRMAQKRKTDALRNFFTENFKRKSLPGENSVSASIFRNQISRKAASVLIPGQQIGSLKQNIQTSEMSLKQIHGGKRLSVILLQNVEKQDNSEGLPVFRDRHYSSDLQQLIQSPDLKNSFNTHKYSPKFDNVFAALKLAQKLQEDEEERNRSESFITQVEQTLPSISPRQTLRHKNTSMFTVPSQKSIQLVDSVSRVQTPRGQNQKLDKEVSYFELNQRLKYPVNPAYFPMKRRSENDDVQQTFLEYCRQQKIPFNKADSLLYEIKKSQDTFEVFKVLFDQATALPQDKIDIPIKLPDGQFHIGWPSRMSTPQKMIRDYEKANISLEPIKESIEGLQSKLDIATPISPTKQKLQRRESQTSLKNFSPVRKQSKQDLLSEEQSPTSFSKIGNKKSTQKIKISHNTLQQSQLMQEFEKSEKRATEKLEVLQKCIDNSELRETERHKIQALLNPIKAIPTLKVVGKEVQKNDSVVKMLNTYKEASRQRAHNVESLSKLIDRINLDRPIMQKEKVDLILFENLKADKNESDQKGHKAIKSSEIRQQLKAVQNKRKIENIRNTRAYFSMIHYLSQRSRGVIAVLPNQLEISFLEVFKKLTESGWIVKLAEFKQILDFVGIDFVDTDSREHNKDLKNFIRKFAEEIGIQEQEIEEIMGINKRFEQKYVES